MMDDDSQTLRRSVFEGIVFNELEPIQGRQSWRWPIYRDVSVEGSQQASDVTFVDTDGR